MSDGPVNDAPVSDTKDTSESASALHALQLEIDVLRAQLENGREETERAAAITEQGLKDYARFEAEIQSLTEENARNRAQIAALEMDLEAAHRENLNYLKSSLSGTQRSVFLRNQLATYQNEIDRLRGR